MTAGGYSISHWDRQLQLARNKCWVHDFFEDLELDYLILIQLWLALDTSSLDVILSVIAWYHFPDFLFVTFKSLKVTVILVGLINLIISVIIFFIIVNSLVLFGRFWCCYLSMLSPATTWYILIFVLLKQCRMNIRALRIWRTDTLRRWWF